MNIDIAINKLHFHILKETVYVMKLTDCKMQSMSKAL